VAADPAETEDLSEDPDHVEDLERLRDRLAEWREAVDDPAF